MRKLRTTQSLKAALPPILDSQKREPDAILRQNAILKNRAVIKMERKLFARCKEAEGLAAQLELNADCFRCVSERTLERVARIRKEIANAKEEYNRWKETVLNSVGRGYIYCGIDWNGRKEKIRDDERKDLVPKKITREDFSVKDGSKKLVDEACLLRWSLGLTTGGMRKSLLWAMSRSPKDELEALGLPKGAVELFKKRVEDFPNEQCQTVYLAKALAQHSEEQIKAVVEALRKDWDRARRLFYNWRRAHRPRYKGGDLPGYLERGLTEKPPEQTPS